MANVYVYSGAAGAGTGADWANAYTTLNAALTAKAAGDDFWVAHDHAQTQASALTLTSPGTVASPNRVICVDRTGTVPPVSADLRTTATITTTGNNTISITGNGVAYCYGIIFSSGNSTGTASINVANLDSSSWLFEACALRLGGSGANSVISLGTANIANYVRLKNTTVQFGNTNQSIRIDGRVVYEGTASAITGATIPSTLFKFNLGGGCGSLICDGVDLSAAGSGKTLVATSNTGGGAYVFLKDCKLGASVTVAATPGGPGQPLVDLVRCDSGDTNYRAERYRYEGAQTVETTVVRAGGASDGTTPIASKLVTTANSKRYLPFEVMPISIWNETTGSAITLTLEGVWGGGAVPTNADIWMDVEYLGTSGFPVGSFATSGPADPLAAGTNLTSSSETWGGSTTKFKMEKTITPQEKGPITIYVKAALASSTFYIDPKVTVS